MKASEISRWVYIRPTDPAVAIPVYLTLPLKIVEAWTFDGIIPAGGSVYKHILPEEPLINIRGFITCDKAYEFRVEQGIDSTKILHTSTISGLANEVIKIDISRSAKYMKLEMKNLDATLDATAMITLIEARI